MEIKRIIHNNKDFALYILRSDRVGYFWEYVKGTHNSHLAGDYPRIKTNKRTLLFCMPFQEGHLDGN